MYIDKAGFSTFSLMFNAAEENSSLQHSAFTLIVTLSCTFTDAGCSCLFFALNSFASVCNSFGVCSVPAYQHCCFTPPTATLHSPSSYTHFCVCLKRTTKNVLSTHLLPKTKYVKETCHRTCSDWSKVIRLLYSCTLNEHVTIPI